MLDGCHFDVELLQESLKIKQENFGDTPIGVLVMRHNDKDSYSYNPSILLLENMELNKIVNWVAVISNHTNDLQNLEYVKQFTNIPCHHFTNYDEFTAFQVKN